ncbi:hypothetical protein PC112_g16053 [Phytophthora cactorum]|nr:hypothetical protein PC112_g16053 [Phytophthora cactorum]
MIGVVDFHIRDELEGERLVLIFDGFTDTAKHGIAVFAANRYGRDVANMNAIVAGNMETNKTVARRIKLPMIGCAAHRFHLPVREWLELPIPLIKKVSALMRKLKTVKHVAKLKGNECDNKSIVLHELRWSGCYRTPKRFEDLQPYLHLSVNGSDEERGDDGDHDADSGVPSLSSATNVHRVALNDPTPSASEHPTITALLDEMTAFDVNRCHIHRQERTVATVVTSSISFLMDTILWMTISPPPPGGKGSNFHIMKLA